MKIRHIVKNLQPIQRNKEWFMSPIKPSHKFKYYPNLFYTYSTIHRKNKRKIKYLGRDFYFDNIASPLNLQNYPYEISHKIANYLEKPPRNILDIGGNIGQFSITANYFWPKTKICIVEPNPEVYSMLSENVKSIKNIRIHNVAIGPKSKNKKIPFYYEHGRSATGSFIKNNLQSITGDIRVIDVDIVDDVNKLTGIKHYDLIKIDVEGFEYEVLKVFKKITCKYLFIEGSVGRDKAYTHSKLLSLISEKMGSFEILYMSEINKQSQTFDCLLKFTFEPS